MPEENERRLHADENYSLLKGKNIEASIKYSYGLLKTEIEIALLSIAHNLRNWKA